MQSGVAAVAGAGLGAGLMYLLDPNKGKRRRATVRDAVVHAGHLSRHAFGKTTRDLDHHVRGLVAQVSSRSAEDHPTDAVLAARVRAKLGRVVSYPSVVTVTAAGGRVTVSGPLLANEISRLLATVRRVRGVNEVETQLEVHQRVEELSGLRDRLQQRALQPEPLRGHWSPTERIVAVAAGGALAGYGLSRRDLAGSAMGVLGVGVLMRGLTNLTLGRLIGVGVGRRAVDIEKTIIVPAPVDQIYALWSHPQNLPRCMAHVRNVWQVADDCTHWIVTGPAGIPVAWDAEVTQRVPNELLAWQTLPGSLVSHAGTVRFERSDSTSARIDVRLRYTPPAGVLGHMLATLLGADARHVLDEDLLRFKSVLELGKTHIHGEIVTREELISQGNERAGG
jgi:uncharacterized membrane protein